MWLLRFIDSFRLILFLLYLTNGCQFKIDNLPTDEDDRKDAAKEQQLERATVGGRALILHCPLPDTHPAVEQLRVSLDPDTEGGSLIVDPHFGPKWRLVSTRDPTIVYLPQCIKTVDVLDKRDDVLGVRMMRVEYKPEESPLPDKSLKHLVCFPNSELLQSMVRVYHGSDRLKASGRGRGGRGRGGRGRGRGRR